jgi:hypothetical protein
MFNEFVQWLQSQGVPLRPTNNGFLTLCPAHSDSQPSLSISEGNNGRVLLHCFAQCDYRAIADAFVQQGANPAWFGLSPRVTLSDLAQGDRQLLATLQALGCVEQDSKVGFPVTYADGTQGFHFRIALDGKGKWKHQSGGKASEAVFALHHERVQQAIARCQAVIVTESPLDVATLLAASKWTNLPAISILGKGNAKALSVDLHRQTLSDALNDGGTIYAWVEPDADGFAQQIADALQRPVKAISTPDAERKDAYRLWLALNKDWDAFAKAIRDLVAQATEVIPQQPTQGKRLPNAVWTPLREITRPDPNEKWQVDGLIKAGNLVILSARPKTAKSIVGLNLAACVAMGRPFFDRPTEQGRALFVAWERHDLTVQRAFAMGLDVCEDFMIWDRRRFGIAPRVDALDWWREFITTNNIRLVVFDTLAHFLRPELDKVRNALNAYDYIGSVLERVTQIANETGCTFVLVHHDRKGEGDTDEQRVLGTTALTAAADVVLQLQPIGDDAGVTMLKATGNAIEDLLLYFAIRPDFWLEPTERPAVAKEDKAARALVDYLRQHEQAKRKDLEAYLRDIGLAESASAAEKLFERALHQLHGKVTRTQRGTYTLAPDFRHFDTPIRDVGVVGNAEPLSDLSDIPDITPMSEMSEVSEMSETPSRFPTKPTNPIVSSESREDDNGQDWQWDWLASDTPILPELVTPENPPIACHRDEGIVQYPPSPCCREPIEPDKDSLAVCVGCGRRWQWVGTSWRPADLSEGNPPEGDAPSPAHPTDPNFADRPPQPDQPDAAFVDAEAWIAQWASDPPPADAPTDPTDPDPAPAHPTVTDLETGEPLVVGTNAWLEATFGTACPDCGTTLTDGACPTCGYPDDRPQWRIGRLVMAIAKALRSRHPQCRSAPCDACRQVVARMNRAVVANDWQGLIALWREVTTDGDDEVS